jgi:protein tyrosine phosphatase (PTP) superfamily phosphohydrolase (DUF442 family)
LIKDACFYGAQPEDNADFQYLQDLGIRTIISVDGATPQVDTAKDFGLRYVHFPLGYDGVSENRRLELAKAFESLARPIYVHCHHGKHRAPTAAAVGLISLGEISVERGQAIQAEAGTSPRYRGLLESVSSCTPLTPQQLESIEVEFNSVAPTQPLVTLMVQLDEAFLELESRQIQNWPIANDSNIDSSKASSSDSSSKGSAKKFVKTSAEVRLHELLQEYRRGADYKRVDHGYRTHLDRAWTAATLLRAAVETLPKNHSTAAPEATKNLLALKSRCNACHTQFRDTVEQFGIVK